MRLITKKISLLFMLSAVLFLSSCLDTGKGSYAGKKEYSYIARDQTTSLIYARTISGNLITSEKIKTLSPGSIAFLTYEIDLEKAEQTMIGFNNNVIVYTAVLGAEPTIAEQSRLRLTNAPEAPAIHFENIFYPPTFSSNDYFDDRWLFHYVVKLKKGETVKADFYTTTETASNGDSNEIIIDIRLTKSGDADNGPAEMIEEYVVADFSDLRSMYKESGKDNIKLKFRFYKATKENELYTTSDTFTMSLK